MTSNQSTMKRIKVKDMILTQPHTIVVE